jgi:hypothetical protein
MRPDVLDFHFMYGDGPDGLFVWVPAFFNSPRSPYRGLRLRRPPYRRSRVFVSLVADASAMGQKRRFGSLLMAFAVGTRVTSRPPHRSVRAQFGHTAPTLGV